MIDMIPVRCRWASNGGRVLSLRVPVSKVTIRVSTRMASRIMVSKSAEETVMVDSCQDLLQTMATEMLMAMLVLSVLGSAEEIDPAAVPFGFGLSLCVLAPYYRHHVIQMQKVLFFKFLRSSKE